MFVTYVISVVTTSKEKKKYTKIKEKLEAYSSVHKEKDRLDTFKLIIRKLLLKLTS